MVATGIDLVQSRDAEDTRRAADAVRALSAGRAVFVGSRRTGAETPVPLPDDVVDLLLGVLGHLARGEAVTVAPLQTELTTQQAADLLNVSRPYVVTLLERGEIPYHRVGNRRRVRLSDVLAYRERQDADAGAALRELSAEGQELGLGY